MGDKYDAEIDRISHLSFEELAGYWSLCEDDTIFAYCDDGTGGKTKVDEDVTGIGCPIQIRGQKNCFAQSRGAFDVALSAAIRADKKIPKEIEDWEACWDDIPLSERVALLQPLAEWQRALDATIRVGKPWHDDFTPRRTESTGPKPVIPVEV